MEIYEKQGKLREIVMRRVIYKHCSNIKSLAEKARGYNK